MNIYSWISITDVVEIQEPILQTMLNWSIHLYTFLIHVQCIDKVDYIEIIPINNLYQINMINWICLFVCLLQTIELNQWL